MDTVEYIELFWDCPECGQTHISAVFNPQGNRCPSCLTWRLDAIALYEAPDSQIITDPKLINRPPFWVCKVCDAVNADAGLAARLLQCENCHSYQTSEVGGISGDQVQDQQAPPIVAVGTSVELKQSTPPKSSNTPAVVVGAGIAIAAMTSFVGLGSAILFGLTRSPTPLSVMPDAATVASDSKPLQVTVTDLTWVAETDIEQQKIYTRESWKGVMPPQATVLKSETRENKRSERQGFRTIMVPEQYQSGTRTETYTESEKYQSGTTTKTDYTSERYQSGTKNETYSESERYQSGTEQKCQTTSRGNGVGQRSCSSVPVYSTRQISRSRSVPTYSTRQVPRTQSVPVYSTRPVERSRSLPVYSTRQIPVQEPIIVTIPFSDTWTTYQVREWAFQRTQTDQAKQDAPRQPAVKITKQPLQRIARTRMKCQLEGEFNVNDRQFGSPMTSKVGIWKLPCEEYDRVNIRDRVQLRLSSVDSANLVSAP
jgi:hypothetical protein